MRYVPRKLVIEESVFDSPLATALRAKYPGAPVMTVKERRDGREEFTPDDLVVARNKGRFIKKCPGTPVYQCCAYHVLNIGIGCWFNCSYCFLHQYMNTPMLVYANHGEMVDEVRAYCADRLRQTIRLGSGEFVDSVGIDELAGVNELLVPAISRIPNAVFEIKTKSDRIERLLDLEHGGRTVVSWSVNSEAMIAHAEPQTASLKERLLAAAACQAAGYKIGFHFDPLIHYAGWRRDYRRVVDMIFDSVEAENIAWISLGALRFNPALKPAMMRKFPDNRLVYGELVPGLDGKLRYFLPIRRRIFAALTESIRERSDTTTVYLCMENKELADAVGATAGFALKGWPSD